MFLNLKFLSILNKILSKNNRTRSLILKEITDYGASLREKDKLAYLEFVSKNKNVREMLNLQNPKDDKFVDAFNSYESTPSLILTSFLSYFKDNISTFLNFEKIKENIEKEVSIGDFDNALKLIDKIDQSLGKSLWSMNCRMSITYYQTKDTEALSKQAIISNGRLRHISYLLYQKYTAKSQLAYQQQSTNHLLNKLKSENNKSYASFLNIFLLGQHSSKFSELNHAVSFTQKLYALDKYIYIKEIMSAYVSKRDESRCIKEFDFFISEIASICGSKMWSGIWGNLNKKYKIKTNDRLNEILTLYSKGDYEKTLALCDKFITDYPSELCIIDIYSKSFIYSHGKEFNTHTEIKTLSYTLIDNLIKLYLDTKNYESMIFTLEEINFRFCCFDFIKSALPSYYLSFPFINTEKLKLSCKIAYNTSKLITPKHINIISTDDYTLHNFSNEIIPTESLNSVRKNRSALELELLKENPDSNNVERLLKTINSEKDLILSERFQIKSIALIKTGKINDLIKLVVNKCIEENENFVLFPTNYIARLIESNLDYELNNLYTSIFCYLYYKLSDQEFKDITSEFLESYLNDAAFSKPSDMLSKIELLSNEEVYFFTHVCEQDILGGMLSITTSRAMMLERIRIINLLQGKFQIASPLLEVEERGIYNTLLLNKLSTQHLANKITIDVKGLRNAKFVEYEMMLGITTTLLRTPDKFKHTILPAEEKSPEENIASGGNNVDEFKTSPSDRLEYYYGVVYSQIINDFIMHNEFGLVRYLSSEIRHGVMPNQMRSVFEANKLVTSIGVDGDYEQNTHWINMYSHRLNEIGMLHLQKCLSEFSGKVDHLINKANQWTKPVMSEKKALFDEIEKESAFQFIIDNKMIADFSSYLYPKIIDLKPTQINENHVNDFFIHIENFIWIQMDECFRKIKQMLNEKLKPEFFHICDELQRNLDKNNNTRFLSELTDAITESRNSIIEKIIHIEQWFRRPVKVIDENVSISDALNAAIYCTQGIYEPVEIYFEKKGTLSTVKNLNGNKLLCLTRALVTLFMNCLKHGRDKAATKIKINTHTKNNRFSIEIFNSIDANDLLSLESKDVKNKVEAFPTIQKHDDLVKEGGTGLYKAYKNLADGFNDFSFSVNFNNIDFLQKVTINTESL